MQRSLHLAVITLWGFPRPVCHLPKIWRWLTDRVGQRASHGVGPRYHSLPTDHLPTCRSLYDMRVRRLDWKVERRRAQTFLIGGWHHLSGGLSLHLNLFLSQAVAHQLARGYSV